MSVATLKTPISYYGGKQTLMRHIKPLVPEHVTYTEAFVGGGALFFAKEPSEVEVINDVNGALINFYRVLKSRFPELKQLIDETLHSRRTHEFAQLIHEFGEFFDPVQRAWALWVLSKMSFAAQLDSTFGYDKTKNTTSKKITNSKEQFTESLAKRLEHTQIEQTNALRIIQSRDNGKAFHFVDPPYIGTACGHYSGTFNLMDFQDLLELLSAVKGKFMLTMFPHPLLDEFVRKNTWVVHQVERTISASKTNRRKQVELMVCNY
ncbi:MAG: DNA adenine methylase [Draconibacterium sp.]